MKKNIFKAAGLSVIALGCVAATIISLNKKEDKVVTSAANYTYDDFGTYENWYYSGKGFVFDFTFEPVSSTQTDNFCLLSDTGDARISSFGKLTFYPDGTVTSNIGNVIRNGDYYSLFAMFTDFEVYSGASGHETCKKLYVNNATVQLFRYNSKAIESKLYTIEENNVRKGIVDDTNGLEFKAFLPTIDSSNKYGMAIVPYDYIGTLDDDYIESFENDGISIVKTYSNPVQLTSSSSLYSRYGSGYYISASIKDIKESNYTRNYTAIPFEEDTSGNLYYASNVSLYKNNIYDVCEEERLNPAFNLFNLKTRNYISNIVNHVSNARKYVATSKISAYVVNPTTQFMKNETEITAIDSNEIKLSASKGETETAQVILKAYSNAKFLASFSNLKSDSNVFNNKNIETHVELYQNVATNWSIAEQHYLESKAKYPTGYEVLPTGYFPDAILPMDVATRSGQNIASTTNGSNQGLFFRFKVPSDAKAGTYKGKLLVNVLNDGVIVIPVTLTVQDFAVKNVSKYSMQISRQEIKNLYPSFWFQDHTSKLYTKAYDLLHERNVYATEIKERYASDSHESYIEVLKEFKRSGGTFYVLPFSTVKVTLDWKTTAGKTVTVPDFGIILSDDDGSSYGLKTIIQDIVDHSTNELNLIKDAYVYDPHADEPGDDDDLIQNILNNNSVYKSVDYVINNTDFTGKEEVLAALQEVRYFLTCEPNKGLMDDLNHLKSISNASESAAKCSCAQASDVTYLDINCYCPNIFNNWNYQGNEKWAYHEQAVANGVKFFEYTCIQPEAPYPSYIINAPMTRLRTNRWRQFKNGDIGTFYYLANRVSKETSGGSEIPSSELDVLNGFSTFSGAYGDGLLIYPVHNTYGYADMELYYLSSLRLENISEGNDDYNYLAYAQELIDSLSVDKATYQTRLDNILNSIGSTPVELVSDGQVLLGLRLALTTLINDLLKL